jgi:hypothetical protein
MYEVGRHQVVRPVPGGLLAKGPEEEVCVQVHLWIVISGTGDR